MFLRCAQKHGGTEFLRASAVVSNYVPPERWYKIQYQVFGLKRPPFLNENKNGWESPLRLRGGGYSLGLRDSIMIAHSFKGEEFGPAQSMHGATYTVDVEFHVKELEPRLNWVLDIGNGMDILKAVLAQYNFKNLDEMFPGENTTTEFMCKTIFDALAMRLKGKMAGEVTVKLWESHKAWASYHGSLSGKAHL